MSVVCVTNGLVSDVEDNVLHSGTVGTIITNNNR